MMRACAPGISLLVALVGITTVGAGAAGRPQRPTAEPGRRPERAASRSEPDLLRRYCYGCHSQRVQAGGLALEGLDRSDVAADPVTWEKVVRKLRGGMMPPLGQPRPDAAAHDAFLAALQADLDRAFRAHPDPGRTETFHRLNRTEYQNVVRDLLALDVDVVDLLPADDSSYGFDNIAGVLQVSQALMERYLAAARTVSRMAVGAPPPAVNAQTYRIAPDSQQHDRVAGLPFGTRGGKLVRHFFPRDGEYDIRVELGGLRNARESHELEFTVDGEQIGLVEVTSPAVAKARASSRYAVDGRIEVRVTVRGGPHEVGVAFLRQPPSLVEQVREPFQNPRISGNDGGPGGDIPAVTAITIAGPHGSAGPGDTPSRRRVFVCQPVDRAREAACAKSILTTLTRRAYRGLVMPEDVDELLSFFRQGRAEGGSFDAGIELALQRLLVSPQFLFRIEVDPASTVSPTPRAGSRPGGAVAPGVYRISDRELASRMSFFIWSSLPDDELLTLAEQGRLNDPATIERQVARMLRDPRASALTTNFAAQWLLLRNMATVRPGDPFSLTFDETLREGFQRETELFVDSIVRENRSALDLLTADYTFLNERVATHYGIPGIQGSHFRRVALPADSPRRGILGHGSVLTVTSHAVRTSPVLRGKWILNNILGTPPPDPPANVPALPDRRTQAKVKTIRERMAQHRSNPVCASCHSFIDPPGFALENFDAIGRWRTVDESFNTIDASGALPDGTTFDDVAGLRAGLVRRPERFINTLAEKMLVYALGRGLESYDMPAVRRIVRDAATDQYRVQSIVVGVVRSYPFQYRRLRATSTEGDRGGAATTSRP
ncbi:MAG: DUF1592 domain-containing protein [Vicinamibacterales bacterium]